jgi:transcriptional regulator
MSEAIGLDEDLDTAMVGEDPQPTLDLGARAGKRQAIDDLMARAMNGLLPRSRSLKPWEPDQIDERHLQAIMMRASGLPQKTIASVMGWNDSWTSVVLNHPDAQYILTKMVSYAADEVLDIQTRIKAHAGEALDKVVEVMRSTQDQRLASANAFELLKMAGYGAVEKKEVKTELTVAAASVDLLSEAIKESQQIMAVEGVDYRVMGSGDASSVPPATPADSGRSDVHLPPSGDSPVLSERVA